jgi:hypothetical protein
MTDAMKAEQAEKKDTGYGSVTFQGTEFAIARKPNPLLISELAQMGSGDPEALGVIAEFFQNTLADYAAFKRAVYTSETEVGQEELSAVLSQVMEKTLGRPTQ